jgi:hypothetical protein
MGFSALSHNEGTSRRLPDFDKLEGENCRILFELAPDVQKPPGRSLGNQAGDPLIIIREQIGIDEGRDCPHLGEERISYV